MSTGFGKMGKQYWQNELQNMLGIQSGSMIPTDLPEYKGMANMYNSQSNQAMNRAVQTMGQRGITGGAAGQYLSNANETNMANMLKMIQGIYQNANQRGTQAANTGLDLMKFWENMKLEQQKLDMAHDAQKSQNRQNDFGQWAQVIKTAMAMAAAPFTMGASTAALPTNTGGVGGVSDLANMYGKKFSFLG
jgi:hypothetical protein